MFADERAYGARQSILRQIVLAFAHETNSNVPVPAKRGGLNWSMKHWGGVFWGWGCEVWGGGEEGRLVRSTSLRTAPAARFGLRAEREATRPQKRVRMG